MWHFTGICYKVKSDVRKKLRIFSELELLYLLNLRTCFFLVKREFIANRNSEYGSDSNSVISLLISLFYYPRIPFEN